MNFFNCLRLIHELVKANILTADPNDVNRVFVYREAGENPEDYPEGWYSENAFDVARELVNDPEDQNFLLHELAEKGVGFQEEELYEYNEYNEYNEYKEAI